MAYVNADTPQISTAAILKDSAPVSKDVPQVSGVEFDDYAHRDISVVDLLSGMENMGFQASRYLFGFLDNINPYRNLKKLLFTVEKTNNRAVAHKLPFARLTAA